MFSVHLNDTMLCSHHTSHQLIVNGDTGVHPDPYALAYCQIDLLSIILNTIFIAFLIMLAIIRSKKFVDFEHLNSSQNFNATANADQKEIDKDNPVNQARDQRAGHHGHLKWFTKSSKRRNLSLLKQVMIFYNKYESLVRQVSQLALLSFKLILALELLLVWHLCDNLFIVDSLSIILSLISELMCFLCSRRHLYQRTSARKARVVRVVITVVWTWSVLASLGRFVVVSVDNKNHYLTLVRVHSYLALFVVYSILLFVQLADLLSLVSCNFL